jgi:DNA repair protein RadC
MNDCRRNANDAPAQIYRAFSRTPTTVRRGSRLACAEDVYRYLADVRIADREHFVALDLDTRHRLIDKRVVHIGTLTGVECHPREVFRPAIVNAAAAIIVAHNHPSGDPTPSRQDLEVTARLREVGELVGIELLDHVVLAEDGFTSLASRGWI